MGDINSRYLQNLTDVLLQTPGETRPKKPQPKKKRRTKSKEWTQVEIQDTDEGNFNPIGETVPTLEDTNTTEITQAVTNRNNITEEEGTIAFESKEFT